MRELFDQGLTLDAAARIVELQDQLDTARNRIDELEAARDGAQGSAPDHEQPHTEPPARS
jgi:hypothetical protein